MTPAEADRAAWRFIAAINAGDYDALPDIGRTEIGNDVGRMQCVMVALASIAANTIVLRDKAREHLHVGVYL